MGRQPRALAEARAAVASADMVSPTCCSSMNIFRRSCPTCARGAMRCDAFVGVIADPQIVKLTRMGDLDMAKPASAWRPS
jgi:magnesium chelatase subunit H